MNMGNARNAAIENTEISKAARNAARPGGDA
jgi:hypothetical protein